MLNISRWGELLTYVVRRRRGGGGGEASSAFCCDVVALDLGGEPPSLGLGACCRGVAVSLMRGGGSRAVDFELAFQLSERDNVDDDDDDDDEVEHVESVVQTARVFEEKCRSECELFSRCW